MLQYMDSDRRRFRNGPDIVIGDIARLPFRLRNGRIETTTWEVIAFGVGDYRHCVFAQRRCDGHVAFLAMHLWRCHVGDADVYERPPQDAQARHQRRRRTK